MSGEASSDQDLYAHLKRLVTIKSTSGTYTCPLFKFLKSPHADDLIKKGSLRLGNISTYRDPELGGLICDKFEGVVDLKTEYGIEGTHAKITRNTNLQVDGVFVYCTTRNLLSDSINWALSEEKDVCVLIVDPVDFARSITQYETNEELVFAGGQPCIYKGRSFRFEDELAKQLYDYPFGAAFLKDSLYQKQNEFRIAWHLNVNEPTTPEYYAVQLNNKPKAILVLYKNLDRYFDPEIWVGMIGVQVFDHDGQEMGGFEVEQPRKIFFPIIYDEDEKTYLSFCPEGGANYFSNGYIRVSIVFSDIGPLFGKFLVDSIGHIQYNFYPNARYVPGQQRVI